ncbi:MAG TPA: hypothetical protein VE623_13635 [Acidimicrobiales bacterium]|jgi:hypothetical protein|nr:hypothetical protein [Acidimicrobiales bacterium]
MHETCALSYAELDATPGELVPERETLALVNITNVVAVNIALAVNAATINSTANAAAGQLLAVGQF